MSQTILLVPTGVGVGLPTVIKALSRAIAYQGVRANAYQPIQQDGAQQSLDACLNLKQVEHMLSDGEHDEVLEIIVANCQQQTQDMDVLLVQGLLPTRNSNYATPLNVEMCKALDAKVLLVTSPGQNNLDQLADTIEITARHYGGINGGRVLGCIVNKVGEVVDEQGYARLDLAADSDNLITVDDIREARLFKKRRLKLLGCIPWQAHFIAPRVKDVADFLAAQTINQGDWEERRIEGIALCARSVTNITSVLIPGRLIITAGDRSDVIVATCLAALSGIKIAALLLTGDYPLADSLIQLCEKAFAAGLPVLSVETDSFRTAIRLQNMDREIPHDDVERLEFVTEFSAQHIAADWIKQFIAQHYEPRLSPPAFRYQLVEKARLAKRRIVLPEGNEPRTIAAANSCVQRKIASCILLGDKEEIYQIATHNGLDLHPDLCIINPKEHIETYVKPMVALRQHKGLTEIVAREQLEDPVVLGTMMLQQGYVDGLVSGAVNTTANTIRPALQLIKTKPNAKLVSSVFFMCLPDQVLVYGDCAVNPDPNVEELADIAIQAADSAKSFEIVARVAMISYSTGRSGQGSDVDKVRKATDLVKKLRPDIVIDGPLQYDAALNANVAKSKAPDSPVAGQATVFIFPDLNTGNTTYKAVQRSADVLSIGPMLQGMNKPVNDLSRGASIDDIIYTIALTAIQA